MTETKINIDATFGAEVKVGDRIKAGQRLGVGPDCGQRVFSEVGGLVREIVFDPQEHQFVVVIES